MIPEPVGRTASKAHDMADAVYQKLTAPDRPIEPEPDKKPWLAGALSFMAPGLGQFYNRQLAKAVALFFLAVVVNVPLLLVWALISWLSDFTDPEGWPHATLAFIARLGVGVPVVLGGLWVFGIIDAWRTAAALRDGRKVVRYGFFRQTGYLAAGFVPGASYVLPEETVRPEEVTEALGTVAKKRIIARIIRRVLKRFLQLGILLLGVVPMLIGAYLDWPVLTVAGAVVVLASAVSALR